MSVELLSTLASLIIGSLCIAFLALYGFAWMAARKEKSEAITLKDQDNDIVFLFDDEKLVISHESTHDQVYFAYFAPYSMERHADLIAFAQNCDYCEAETLGSTLDGQPIDCLCFGSPETSKIVLWMIARQHPGKPWLNGGWKA